METAKSTWDSIQSIATKVVNEVSISVAAAKLERQTTLEARRIREFEYEQLKSEQLLTRSAKEAAAKREPLEDSRADRILGADLEDIVRGVVFNRAGVEYHPLGDSKVWRRPVREGSCADVRKKELMREWKARDRELVREKKDPKQMTVSRTVREHKCCYWDC